MIGTKHQGTVRNMQTSFQRDSCCFNRPDLLHQNDRVHGTTRAYIKLHMLVKRCRRQMANHNPFTAIGRVNQPSRIRAAVDAGDNGVVHCQLVYQPRRTIAPYAYGNNDINPTFSHSC